MFDHTSQTVSVSIAPDISTIVDAVDAELLEVFHWGLLQSNRQYARARVSFGGKSSQKTLLLHRLILERVMGRVLMRTEFVDHIDGNTLNNRRSNLRLATNAENLRNRKRHKNNQSGYKGVYRAKGRHRTKPWTAQIVFNGKQIRLGHFETPEEAYECYCKAAQDLHGEFARLV